MLVSVLLSTFVLAGPHAAAEAKLLERSRIPLPPKTTAIMNLPDCGRGGCVFYPEGPVLVDPKLDGRTRAFVMFAELGHLFDWRALTDSDRARYEALRGYAGTPWIKPGPYPDPEGTPSESFSEDYARCALGDRHRDEAVCGFLQSLGGR